jgi:hypothetical protein
MWNPTNHLRAKFDGRYDFVFEQLWVENLTGAEEWRRIRQVNPDGTPYVVKPPRRSWFDRLFRA